MNPTTKVHIEYMVENHLNQMLQELNIDDCIDERDDRIIQTVTDWLIDLYEQEHGTEC